MAQCMCWDVSSGESGGETLRVLPTAHSFKLHAAAAAAEGRTVSRYTAILQLT
jgi:hypothetical protein